MAMGRKVPAVKLVVVGSLALDTVETPAERRENLLGGSASYACAAASFFTRTGMVAVAGWEAVMLADGQQWAIEVVGRTEYRENLEAVHTTFLESFHLLPR